MVVFEAIKRVFSKKQYILWFLFFVIVMLSFFIIIPVLTVVGNSIQFQLSTFTLWDYVLMIILALLTALFFVFQIYGARHAKKRVVGIIGKGSAGGLGAVFAGIVGTAWCASCLIPLFGFFGIGFGGVVFFLEYRAAITVLSATFLLVGMYFSARSIIRACDACKL